MPRRMVNGVYEKVKKYCGCGKLLTGLRSRYCSQSCYDHQRKEKEREHYAATHPPLPNKDCVHCGHEYRPRVNHQLCCSTPCRDAWALIQGKARRKRDRESRGVPVEAPQKWWLGKSRFVKSPTQTAFPVGNSDNAAAIKQYLNSGGEITVLAPQADGRIPGVNIPLNMRNIQSHNSWGLDTSMGHGYELDIMDEIYTTSEVVNEL